MKWPLQNTAKCHPMSSDVHVFFFLWQWNILSGVEDTAQVWLGLSRGLQDNQDQGSRKTVF